MRMATALLAVGCLLTGATAQETTDAKSTLQNLEAAWNKAVDLHRKKQQEEAKALQAEWAKAEKEGRKITRAMRAYSPFPEKDVSDQHIAAFQAAAERFSGTPAAVPFHLWVAENGRWNSNRDATKKSVDTLMKAHAKSTNLERLARVLKELRRMLGRDYCDDHLRALLKTNTEPNTRAFALFALTEDSFAEADSGSAEYKMARAKMVKAGKMATKPMLQSVIQGKIDLREKLGEGSIAPDIIGVDMDGTAFKLSDYKGKVIMLDFWGDW